MNICCIICLLFTAIDLPNDIEVFNNTQEGKDISSINIGIVRVEYDEIQPSENEPGATKYTLRGRTVLVAQDENKDGRAEIWFRYDDAGMIDMMITDVDGDGEPDAYDKITDDAQLQNITGEGKIITGDKTYNMLKNRTINYTVNPPKTLLDENFDAENKGLSKHDYVDFKYWSVEQGTVDLIFGELKREDETMGLLISLNGLTRFDSGFKPTILRTREAFMFSPGRYRLTFEVYGSVKYENNCLHVIIGALHEENITVENYRLYDVKQIEFNVTDPISAPIIFEHTGADWDTIEIDDIRLERIPTQ